MTRPEEQRDPEADADFDRELAKMMAESVESRKFDRKPAFDVPLPMRRPNRDASANTDENIDPRAAAATAPNTMKFSLLSKRGNRQQVGFCWSKKYTIIQLLTSNCRLDQSICRLILHLLLRYALSNKLSAPSSNASRALC